MLRFGRGAEPSAYVLIAISTQFTTAQRAPHALGGQWQIRQTHAGEPGQRVGDGRAYRDQTALAYPFRAERPGAVAVLHEQRLEARRHVLGAWHPVAHEVSVQQRAALVDHLLEQRVTDALHHRALVLGLALLGVDAAA